MLRGWFKEDQQAKRLGVPRRRDRTRWVGSFHWTGRTDGAEVGGRTVGD